ncbi:methyltransferase [Sphaerisporangium sp. TRM90804]|uniref:methyltransferase n=1 Tax=Sphaerisporangium sp. TRM90804 TaxID=3031113 RepID=UPI00244693C0|nr:methyltransferase [Sphaerisporangium sp. TRM90804]MDH2427192.1 methyltransferase [Sphaerisporangium sp. TRM90804]
MTSGTRISHVLHAVTALGVADHLADGPLPPGEIAAAAGCDADALARLLRAAAAVGLVERLDDGRYTLTDLSELLRSDVPGGLRDAVLYAGHAMTVRPYGDLAETVRTGEPAFDRVFGMPFYEYGKADPAAGRLMNSAMRHLSSATSATLLDACDLHRFERVADVGGGTGRFLTEVLRRSPAAKGVLVDQPAVVEQARLTLARTEEARRMTFVGADFFERVPAGCDAYVLKSVLHNWGDADAARVLRCVREAIGVDADARLFVFEQVLGAPNTWDNGAFMDIDMMLKFGGRVRDLAEWRRLLGEAGFAPANEPRPGSWTVQVWRPC